MSPRLRVQVSFTEMKSHIAHLEAQLDRISRRNGDLLTANNGYLERARAAEYRVQDLMAERDETLNELGSAHTEISHLKKQLEAARACATAKEFHAEL